MMLKLGFTDDQIVDYLYLASFSRHPRTRSARHWSTLCMRPKQAKTASPEDPRRAALNDMTWAMLTSEEFMFNH